MAERRSKIRSSEHRRLQGRPDHRRSGQSPATRSRSTTRSSRSNRRKRRWTSRRPPPASWSRSRSRSATKSREGNADRCTLSGDGNGARERGAGRCRACRTPRPRRRSAPADGDREESIELRVPNIGDFKDVPVIEVFVKPGDTVAARRPAGTSRIGKGVDGSSVDRDAARIASIERQGRRQGFRRQR